MDEFDLLLFVKMFLSLFADELFYGEIELYVHGTDIDNDDLQKIDAFLEGLELN